MDARAQHAVDLGCGVGRAAVALIPELTTGSYEGFDVVPGFIRWCRREITSRHPQFRFRVADVGNRQYNRGGGGPATRFTFPYPDDSFDLALAASVFTHMEPDGIRRYLAESRRVLRPGGALVADNVLWSGRVLEPKEPDDHALAAFNQHVLRDPRVELVMLPIRDGITIAVKK